MIKFLKCIGFIQIVLGIFWFIASQIILYFGNIIGFLIAACGLAQIVLGSSVLFNNEYYYNTDKVDLEESFESFINVDDNLN